MKELEDLLTTEAQRHGGDNSKPRRYRARLWQRRPSHLDEGLEVLVEFPAQSRREAMRRLHRLFPDFGTYAPHIGDSPCLRDSVAKELFELGARS